MWVRCGMVVVLVLGSGRAGAQTADAVVNACVATGSGRMRIVDAAGACKRKERALAWNVQGPAGMPGPKGDPGTVAPAPCLTAGRLTLAGIVGEGAGGTMTVYAYHVAVDPAAAGGPPTVIDFSVTKRIDASSKAIAQAALAGTPIATGKLEIFGADGATVVATYDFTLALVSSFTIESPARCSSEQPVETITLSVASLTAS